MFIDREGNMRFIYSDEFAAPFLEMGAAEINRASNVEPLGVEWIADMAPSNGPILGPYTYRHEALAAEVSWLEENAL